MDSELSYIKLGYNELDYSEEILKSNWTFFYLNGPSYIKIPVITNKNVQSQAVRYNRVCLYKVYIVFLGFPIIGLTLERRMTMKIINKHSRVLTLNWIRLDQIGRSNAIV